MKAAVAVKTLHSSLRMKEEKRQERPLTPSNFHLSFLCPFTPYFTLSFSFPSFYNCFLKSFHSYLFFSVHHSFLSLSSSFSHFFIYSVRPSLSCSSFLLFVILFQGPSFFIFPSFSPSCSFYFSN